MGGLRFGLWYSFQKFVGFMGYVEHIITVNFVGIMLNLWDL